MKEKNEQQLAELLLSKCRDHVFLVLLAPMSLAPVISDHSLNLSAGAGIAFRVGEQLFRPVARELDAGQQSECVRHVHRLSYVRAHVSRVRVVTARERRGNTDVK